MKNVCIAIVVMTLSSTAAAGDKPNFSGLWTMNVAKSDYGQIPAPESFVRKIKHADPMISIVEEQSGPNTTPTSTREMKTDGQTVVAQINGGDVKLTATWEGEALIATTAIDTFGVTFKDTMSLSEDGHVLTSIVLVESGQGATELKIVFDRQ